MKTSAIYTRHTYLPTMGIHNEVANHWKVVSKTETKASHK